MARGLRSKRLKKLKKIRAVKLEEEWNERKEREKNEPKKFSFKEAMYPTDVEPEEPFATDVALQEMEEKKARKEAEGPQEEEPAGHNDKLTRLSSIDNTIRSHKFKRMSRKKKKTNIDRHVAIFRRVKARQAMREKNGRKPHLSIPEAMEM